jgi:hypothetical protein
MRAVRTLLGVGVVVFACALVADAFGAAPPSKAPDKKHHHTISGVVVEIDHNKDKKGHGLIKVRVHDHHGKAPGKDNKGGEARNKGKNDSHVVTAHVNHHTRFEKVFHSGGGKGKGEGKGKGATTREVLAHFRDLEPGMHVRIKLDHGHHAEEVSIIEEHHKGKEKGKDKGKGKK